MTRQENDIAPVHERANERTVRTVGCTGLTRRTVLALALGAPLLHNTPVLAAETLTLSSWFPPTHPIVVNAIEPWAEQVREATDGEVRVRILAKPLGSPLVHFDLAKDGIADITYGLQSYTKGERFVLSNIAQFPFLGESAESLSAAYWQTAVENPQIFEEHSGTHVLSLFTHGPGILYNRTENPIESSDDLVGLKIRVPGGVANDVVEALGAEQMLVSPSEIYESMSRGVIDGLTMPAETLVSYKFIDAVDNVTRIPGGLYNTTWFLVMNDDRWNSLSAEHQEAITSVSGEAFGRMQGKAWDEADAAGWEAIAEAGIPVTEADEAFLAEIEAAAAPIRQAWVDRANERGVDGAAMLESLRQKAAE